MLNNAFDVTKQVLSWHAAPCQRHLLPQFDEKDPVPIAVLVGASGASTHQVNLPRVLPGRELPG
ncbi:hypothetical protein [Hymenobacter sp. YC55]|uniref:hypothetical protein n=1 Tax=Hymenobacter sp. YC55 TaxID=3034019 RepID=UPI0023F732F9|nr:hypothetical protein [Hymenobacter sp. YC55]MDF7815092.1 hypothetical protein [Hymenobacter sp. YC55]